MVQKSLFAFGIRPIGWVRAFELSIVLLFIAPVVAFASTDLTEMSLEELMSIEVTSVSKKAESKQTAAAAITVITAEDIRRGGFTVIPEALRMVPGMSVGRVDANRWAISIRGNAGLFSNKLLVLIDGRTVYTPSFGGTYWDIQDYPIEDVERIEVIRGPGGTIWGANAVNGVINIITKHSEDTQGGLVSGYGGNREYGLTGRYGGQIGEDTTYRGYARGIGFTDYDVDKDKDGGDEWRHVRFGFRTDSELTEDDTLRISGDFYHQDNDQGTLDPAGFVALPFHRTVHYKQTGGNLLVHWNRKLSEDSNFQAKAYYSRDDRQFLIKDSRDNGELEIQHDFNLTDATSFTWGANYRVSSNHFSGKPVGIPISFDPNDQTMHIASGFGQVQVDFLDDKLSLILGTKLGYYSWSGFEYQPSGRLVLKPTEGHAIWGAISRAVRTPTQAERDISLTIPNVPTFTLLGDRDVRSEELLAFELGYRFFALERFNAELTLFWNEYESRADFTITVPPAFPAPGTAVFTNRTETTNRGVEIEVNLMPTSWWRLKAAYSYLHIDEDQPASPPGLDLGKLDDDNPSHQFNVESFFDLPMGFEFDIAVYYVDGLPGTTPVFQTKNVEQYVRLDLRLGYQPFDWLDLSLVGQNLTDRRHYEGTDFTGGRSTQVPRSGYAKATLTF
jgi:iron complex outermembrane receptor protein